MMNGEYLTPNKWLIEQQAARAFLAQFLHNKDTPIQAAKNVAIAKKIDIQAKQPRVFTGKKKKVVYQDFVESGDDGKHEKDGEIYGAIGIVYLRGAMVSEGNWCVKGTAEIIEEIKDFGDNPNIQGVMLVVDSPGGMVKGTEIFANTVRDFRKNYGKKIFAYVEGSACSAAMWAISGADKIILAETTAMVGSIGTMVTLTDWSKYYELMGIKEIPVYATLSTEKNKAFSDAIAGNDSDLVTTILDPTNLSFLRAIQANRGAKMGEQVRNLDLTTATTAQTPDVLKGRVYIGEEGLTVGLADKIAKEGLDKELELMQSYAREETPNNQPAMPFLNAIQSNNENPTNTTTPKTVKYLTYEQ